MVHKLGHKGPRTTKELLNITTSHATGEEAVGAIFDHLKGKAKRDEGSLMATADRRGGQKPTEGTPNHFEKLLEGPCMNHAFPIKRLYKDCGLMKRFLSGGSNKGEHGKDLDPTTDDTEGKDGGFPTPDDYLMIFGGSAAYDSKCR